MRYKTHGTTLVAALLVAIMALSVFAMPVAAQGSVTHEANFIFDAEDVIDDDSATVSATIQLTDDNAVEGDEIIIDATDVVDDDEDISLESASEDGTSGVIEDIDVSTEDADGELDGDDRIIVELTDLDSNDLSSGADVSINIELEAQDQARDKFNEYDNAELFEINGEETDFDLPDEETVATVDINAVADYNFDADEVADSGDEQSATLTLGFTDDAEAEDEDVITVGIFEEEIADEDNIEITSLGGDGGSATWAETEGDGIDASIVDEGIIEGADAVELKIDDLDSNPTSVEGELITVEVKFTLDDDAADEVEDYDFDNILQVTDDDELQEGSVVEDDFGITSFSLNAGEVDEFDLEIDQAGDREEAPFEMGYTDELVISVDNIEDESENTVTDPRDVEIKIDGEELTRDDTQSTDIDDGEISEETVFNDGTGVFSSSLEPAVGAFDLTVEIEENDEEEEVTIYPDDVDVTTEYPDIDADEGTNADLDVDLGVSNNDDIDQVAVKLELDDNPAGGEIDPLSAGNFESDGEVLNDGLEHFDVLNDQNPVIEIEEIRSGDTDVTDGVVTFENIVETADVAGQYDITATVEPDEFDSLDEETPESDETSIVATGDIAQVDSVEVQDDEEDELELIGVETDPLEDNLQVEITDVQDADGNSITNTAEDITVNLLAGEESQEVQSSVSVDAEVIEASALDPEDFADDTATGDDAVVEIDPDGDEFEVENGPTVVNEVQALDEGWTPVSIHQAVEVVDPAEEVTPLYWNTSDGDYDPSSELGELSGTIEDTELVHYGHFFGVSEGVGELRVGLDYATSAEVGTPTAGEVQIEEGWNLIGSNWDQGDTSNENVDEDLEGVEALGGSQSDNEFVRTSDLQSLIDDPSSDEDISVGDTYWVFVSNGEDLEQDDRAVSAPGYDPSA